jgi:hypothetical protein
LGVSPEPSQSIWTKLDLGSAELQTLTVDGRKYEFHRMHVANPDDSRSVFDQKTCIRVRSVLVVKADWVRRHVVGRGERKGHGVPDTRKTGNRTLQLLLSGACGQQKDHQCQGATKHFCFSRCRHVRFLVRDVVASRDAVQMCVAATQDAAVVSGAFLSAFRRTAFLIMQRLLLSYPRRLAEENKNICLNWRRARPSRSVWQHSHSQFCGQIQYLLQMIAWHQNCAAVRT